jgi:hypothetical protein
MEWATAMMAFLPPASSQAMIQGRQVSPLGVRGGVGHLCEDRPEGLIARTRPAGPLLAGTFIMARGHSGPSSKPGLHGTGNGCRKPYMYTSECEEITLHDPANASLEIPCRSATPSDER